MTKLSNAIKSVQTVEINTVDVAADTVAATLSDMNVSEILETLKGNEAEAFETFVGSVGQGEMVNRIALDASDKPVIRIALDASDLNASVHSVADWQDYSLESTLDSGATVQSEDVQIDPMAQYGDLPVKMAYVFDGMELPMNVIIKASAASVEAAKRANDPTGPKVAVMIRCATTEKELFRVEPMKGARKVAIIPGTRQTSTRTVASAGMSEAEKARIEAERQRKEEERAAKAWDAMVDAAEKDNAKFDKQRDKEIKEMAAKLTKALAKLRNAPKEGTDNLEQFKLFSEENGLTCMEGNHAMNVIKNRADSNYGWKQKGKDFAEDYNKVLIGKFRVCAVAYAKTGKTDRSMKEAMRLIDMAYDNDGNVTIPDGWYVIED